jgi:hypothetical protein
MLWIIPKMLYATPLYNCIDTMTTKNLDPTKPKESKLYPIVERWLRKHHHCFKTATNKGIKYSRIDVIGVRDVGGDLSGEIETISVEVKRALNLLRLRQVKHRVTGYTLIVFTLPM